MKLTVTSRAGRKKTDTKQTRREGNIPGILYAAGKTPEAIVVDGKEYATLTRKITPGQLSTTVFALQMGGKERKAILKEVQYEITRYDVSHLDFIELIEGQPVQVKIPVTITGAVDCAGVKLGGFLRQVVRFVEVECLPKHLPTEFVIDVRELGIGQVKRVSDLKIPEKVTPLIGKDDVIVVIAKK